MHMSSCVVEIIVQWTYTYYTAHLKIIFVVIRVIIHISLAVFDSYLVLEMKNIWCQVKGNVKLVAATIVEGISGKVVFVHHVTT